MIEPLPDDLARLFASERALPPADAVRQAAVRARVWKTLGLGGGGAPPSRGGGGLVVAGVLLVAGAAGGALLLARHERSGATGATSATATTPAAAIDPRAGNGAARLATAAATRSTAPDGAAAMTDWMGQLDVAPRAIDGVVTFGGKPLAGADVTLASPSTGAGGAPLLRVVTGDDGRFRFDDQPAWSYVVVAEHAGLTAAMATIDLRQPGSGGGVTLALTDCATRVRGAIHDVLGGMIAGARVMKLGSPWHGASATSDANGEWSLCVASGPARLRLAAEGYGAQDRLIEVPAAGAIVDVSLSAENHVVGTVVGPDGAPRAGAQVNLWHHSSNANGADAHAVSGERGEFAIDGVAAGRYTVNAWTRDAVTWSAYETTVADGVVEPLALRLDATTRLRGVVVRDGRPVAGADVVATRDGSSDRRSIHARSQEDGSFTLHAVPVGEVAIVVNGRTVVDSLEVGAAGASGLYVDAGAP